MSTTKQHRRHPLEVTVDRLRDHYARYWAELTGAQRDELSHVAYLLEEIAEKRSGRTDA
jgi:hypothetical protein